jgi:enoyl-CoA hydratase/carnithine racemase
MSNSGVEPILLKASDKGVTTLCLNRPEKFNTLSEAMLDALQDALEEIADDPDARCVVISGAGKAFCAGHDLREMRGTPDLAYYEELFAKCSRVMQSVVGLPVPVIARVHGIATAAGCQLVASCDLAIAAKSARFAVSGVNLGLFCSTPSVALSRNVPAKQAFDMLVTGAFIDADAALARDLVSEVADDDRLDEAVGAKVATILAKDPQAVRYGKAAFQAQRHLPLADAYALTGGVMARNMMEPDTQEAIDAFLEKRPAKLSFRSESNAAP